MGFDVYKKICELFLKEEGEEFIFARAFLCLEWNLMGGRDTHWPSSAHIHSCEFREDDNQDGDHEEFHSRWS